MSVSIQALDRIQEFVLERGLSPVDASARAIVQEALRVNPDELDEFFGDGPLAEFFADSEITEVLVNGPCEIWVEKKGSLVLTKKAFASEESLRRYVRRVLSIHGRKVDQRSPFADAIGTSGLRYHVIVPPAVRRGICLSIRKPSLEPWSLSRLEDAGFLLPNVGEFLRECLQQKKNIFVSGGTGSGKTSLLTALLGEVSASERIIALEDVAEIRVNHPHFLTLEARPANQEGEGGIPMRRLLRESLRMRPDRLVIGECRGAEALDLLMALNTGHAGSLGTIHANSPRDALQRLETLALLSSENLREGAVRQLILGGIHVIVQIERGPRGRRVVSVSEVRGLDGSTFMLKETKFS